MQRPVYISEEDEKLWDKLEKVAKIKHRSISYLVNLSIREYLDKNETK
jgi:predicted transcriptional regulator